ncbi:MAG: hypothetical protein ACRCXT_05770, partial [Paraclostridium sp.]
IRLEFKDIFTEQQMNNLEIIKKFYRNNQRVKIKATLNKGKEALSKDDELSSDFKEYEYILDPNLNEFDILTKYINHQLGYEYLTVDELKNIIKEEV